MFRPAEARNHVAGLFMADVLFTLKKISGLLLLPAGLVCLLWLVGALHLPWPGKRRRGLTLILLAGALLAALSMPATGRALLAPLERQAGPYAQPAELLAAGALDIVVLGGAQQAGELSAADRLSAASLRRVAEGVRLWRGVPGARLLFSGEASDGRSSVAADMAEMATSLGASSASIVIDEASRDTADQAAILARDLGARPFALVTSAAHMPRALTMFRAQGLQPLPAPADFRCAAGDDPAYRRLMPQAQGLLMSQDAIYEYLGLMWAWLHDFWAAERPRATDAS